MDPEARFETDRLVLEPLVPEHADEMFSVLNDVRLHDFTGGAPATRDDLRVRYEFLTERRSPDRKEGWLNWVVRVRETGAAVGTVQATIVGEKAFVAWVIGMEWQGNGYASEATMELVARLREEPSLSSVAALIAPGHVASERVADRAGLVVTDETVDGESVWQVAFKRRG